MSFLNLLRRKSRTVLALLGIMIGVAALLVLVGLVEGINALALDAVGGMQGVYVMQDGATDDSLSIVNLSDKSKLEAIQGVKVVTPTILGVPQTVDGKRNSMSGGIPVSVIGTDPGQVSNSLLATAMQNLKEGRMLRSGDEGVVLISTKLSDDRKKHVNSTIKINDYSFKVIGIVEVTSDFYSNVIVLPIEDARKVLDFEEGKVNSFFVVPADPANVDKIDKIIDFKYPDDFDAYSAQETAALTGDILDSLRAMTLVIALISSIVAGIGVMNTMLMSVMERYSEIGVLKAVGWTNNNVMQMILLESMFLGVLGGIAGIVFGILVGELIGIASGLYPLMTPMLISEVFIFAISVSVFAGAYPAFRASRLEPIDALREGQGD
ncbi:MAG: ABC transporter permease [Candidatus Diapherotrites archaeon]|nr:ABC transporter permease [Candidatus Diapherotrites archaeon]